ncbi:MAG: UDP-2,4-diacetamido-2,4,6-trideoxy-beta-L-altropyranose hydrolase [Pseudohongiellaceae bacterium]|nr:UDP-2,4-diacetamido-2,4,6-trideoxy-beta-L-altropyranose hydrolase [Pseudohongiellaceae bacterium]
MTVSISNAVFRVDSSLVIGTGHLRRCLTLANLLKEYGTDCHFITRSQEGSLESLVAQNGHEVHLLEDSFQSQSELHGDEDSEYSSWLMGGWREDSKLCKEILNQIRPEWLIVDHYGIDNHWERELSGCVGQILVIDDLANRQHSCNLLLDQNLGRSPADYFELVPKTCSVLTGPEFALLRPEFSENREYSLQRRKTSSTFKVLISMGGVDLDNVTGRVLDALLQCSLPIDVELIVVMGGASPWIKEIERQASNIPWKVEVKVDASNMAHLMANSDLAIGAVGSTTWERCCLGLPSILIPVAENQRVACKELAETGVAIVVEDDKQFKSLLCAAISELLTNRDLLNRISELSASVTNGLGAYSILERMQKFECDEGVVKCILT